MIGNSPAALNFNRLFLKLNQFICNELPVLPGHWSRPWCFIVQLVTHIGMFRSFRGI
jgi:hypothetical protein